VCHVDIPTPIVLHVILTGRTSKSCPPTSPRTGCSTMQQRPLALVADKVLCLGPVPYVTVYLYRHHPMVCAFTRAASPSLLWGTCLKISRLADLAACQSRGLPISRLADRHAHGSEGLGWARGILGNSASQKSGVRPCLYAFWLVIYRRFSGIWNKTTLTAAQPSSKTIHRRVQQHEH